MHFYSNSKVNATKFTLDDMYAQFGTTNALEEAILHQRRLMDEVDPDKKMGLMVDEWGVWDRMVTEEERVHGRLWQQTTMRAAVTTALGLNVFHRQADKLVMCNVAQMVNVLDAMLLTQNEKCIRTPAYYAFLLMKAHMGKISVKATPPQGNATELSISASRRDDSLVVTVVNPKADAIVRIRCAVRGRVVSRASGTTLFHHDLNAFNSFDKPDTVVPQKLPVQVRPEGMLVDLPALSVSTLEVELRRA
jgi:alpha-N-arabinofuranosidase